MAQIDHAVRGKVKGIWQVEEKVSLLRELWCGFMSVIVKGHHAMSVNLEEATQPKGLKHT